MSIAASPSPRRVGRGPSQPRGGELARTLRTARDRLSSANGLPPRLQAALLLHHATELRDAFPLFAAMTTVAASLTSGFVSPVLGGLWLLTAVAATLPLVGLRQSIPETSSAVPASRSRRRLLFLAHLLLGLPPVLFIIGPFSVVGLGGGIGVLAVSAGLLAFVLLATASLFALPSAFIATISPLVIALAYVFVETEGAQRWLFAFLLGAIPALAFLTRRLRLSLLETLAERADREDMVLALETARIAFDDAKRRAEDASAAKSRFLATMSHELRTPLNAILGFSEVIEKEILGPLNNATYKEYARDIHSSGQHLLALINEILDLSRVEAGRFTLNEEAMEIAPLVRQAIGFVELKAEAKGVSIEQQFQTHLPQVWGDPRAIRQVVLNLLSNAVKFTPGGGTIRVRVGWTAGGGQYVSVLDDGPGIPPEEIPVVLASFGQGASAIKSAEQGTGLGLPIVQALMTLHDGEFRLQSTPGIGTEVIAILPHSRVLEVMPAIQDYG